MGAKHLNDRLLFGLKVKQLRAKKNLSFSELSAQTGISVSYLNEIEKGKKYPKKDKVESLAMALDVSLEHLTSDEYDEHIAPVAELLKSNFLNELPLDLFGIELSKVVEIIASAPARVGAFISTLLEISRNYALREENFYFSALRSYLELHNNYFEDIEQSVLDFEKANHLPAERPLPEATLRNLLQTNYDYTIEENGLDQYPELNPLRGVFLPKSKRLLLSKDLTPIQRSFQYGKELAFEWLGMKDRAYTSSLLKTKSFEEVLNHSRAIYFSVALHMPQKSIEKDMRAFFQGTSWQPEAFVAIMRKYDATPEMFYHRLTNILPRFFGIKKLFFLRFVHDASRDQFEIDRELHLNHHHQPHGNGLEEHYCRRWVALSILHDLARKQQQTPANDLLVGAQLSSYLANQDKYLVLTLARPDYPAPRRNVSVSIGMLLNDNLKKEIKFLEDPSIEARTVHTTCERCSISDCEVRAAEPLIINKRTKLNTIEARIEALIKDQ